ncbi:MAG: hypothetical protein H6817_07575 [Phycisphaerales bacterium]|nr:hypothetical protein [Phycisphaerales bacterium]
MRTLRWSSPTPLLAVGDGAADAARRAFDCVTSRRGRRVLFLLVGVWMLNLFDLTLTLRAWNDGVMYEQNPLARGLLAYGPGGLAVCKLALVGAATAVLFSYRRFRCAEVASMLALLIYVGVAFQWKYCYEMYDMAHRNAVNCADFSRVDAFMRVVPVL